MIRVTRATVPLVICLAAVALTGCVGETPAPSATASATTDAPAAAGCDQVTVVVDFGVLDEQSILDCATAGPAQVVLDEAGITTVGTADYGDQVVCRVNNAPAPDQSVEIDGQAPFVESCLTLNAAAYWALWIKPSADAEWEYAQEGVNTLELAAGQWVGLVYTPGTESTPPEG